MISIEAILLTLPTLKMFLSVEITLEASIYRTTSQNLGSCPTEVFLRKGVLKICSKFTGEHACCFATLWKSHLGMGVLL